MVATETVALPIFNCMVGLEVKMSIDLKQWSPMTTVTNLTGTLEFTDPEAANHSRRFYRAVLK